jgi:hypothetical protein
MRACSACSARNFVLSAAARCARDGDEEELDKATSATPAATATARKISLKIPERRRSTALV